MRALPLLAGVVAGTALGWSLARSAPGVTARGPTEPAASSAVTPDAPQAERPAAERNPPALREAAPPGSQEAPRTVPETEVGGEPELFNEGLRRHVREGLLRGWRTERSDEMPEALIAQELHDFEQWLLHGPEGIGRHKAQRQNERDIALVDIEDADAKTLLAKLDQDDIGPIPELVGDRAAFERLFPPSGGRANDGTADLAHPDAALEDGSILIFPAGVFQVRQLMREKDPFPRDVTVRGAGMDLTLLLLNGMYARQEVENVGFENCTLLANCDLLDGKGISVRLDRVRVIGFDCGAGSSSAFGPRRLALLARNSRFEGGYGRHPAGGGNLFDVRSDGLAARFENCWIDQVREPSSSLRDGATLVFVGCRLTNVLGRRFYEGGPRPGIVLVDTTLEFLPEGEEPRVKDLNALFPDWKARTER